MAQDAAGALLVEKTDPGGLQYLHGTLSILKLQNVVLAEDAAGALLVEKTDLDELVLE